MLFKKNSYCTLFKIRICFKAIIYANFRVYLK